MVLLKNAYIVVICLIVVLYEVKGLQNLIGTPIQSCINCLCHARSGCWSRINCARYSISKTYWLEAGGFSVSPTNNPDIDYKTCIKNENCILNTIKGYTEQFGEKDCNCDGVFDCKDRFAIHLFGKNCMNPKFDVIYSSRFNHCAQQIGVKSMSPHEDSCSLPQVEAV